MLAILDLHALTFRSQYRACVRSECAAFAVYVAFAVH